MARSLEDIVRKLAKINKVIAASRTAGNSKKAKPKISARTSSGKSAPKPVVKKPRAIKALKGMTADQLLMMTQESRKQNAVRDKVTLVSVQPSKNNQRLASKTLTYDNQGPRLRVRSHTQQISKVPNEDGSPATTPFNKSKLKVQCGCEDHMFCWEYALNHHGAADLKYSNGEFPVLKNPSLIPGLCKHLHTIMRYLKVKKL